MALIYLHNPYRLNYYTPGLELFFSVPPNKMKPFLIGILKCKNCPFTSKLHVEASEVKELDPEEYEVLDLEVLKKEDGDLISKIVECFNINEITQEDVREFCKSENTKVSKLLFGTDIVSGSLTCEDCKTVYPIRESILDTVDSIQNK